MVKTKTDNGNLHKGSMPKPDPFFSLSQSSEWNALVGKQGDPIFYAEGYIEAALELAKLIIDKKRYAQRTR